MYTWNNSHSFFINLFKFCELYFISQSQFFWSSTLKTFQIIFFHRSHLWENSRRITWTKQLPQSKMLHHSAWPHRLSPSVTQILTSTMTHAQSEESGIEPGHIATITGSFVSFPGTHQEHYDTDHTDLASEPDEAEIRRELLRDVRLY